MSSKVFGTSVCLDIQIKPTKVTEVTFFFFSLAEFCAGERRGRVMTMQVRMMNGAGKRKNGSLQEIIMDAISRRTSILEAS